MAQAAVGLASLLTLVTGEMLVGAIALSQKEIKKFAPDVYNRRATVFGSMTATGVAAVGVYIPGFIQKREQRGQSIA